jgi:ABC-type multidrug transport system fused ATPase/permease subunit
MFDGKSIAAYDSEAFHRQVGFVFQDSIIFNMSIRENIAFSDTVTDESLQKAIDTAELKPLLMAVCLKARYHCIRARLQPFRGSKTADYAGTCIRG